VPLVAAAVCPHPPLLVPELAAGAAVELDELRAACQAAVARVSAAAVDALVVVGVDTTTVRRGAPYGGTFSAWGVDLAVGEPGGEPLPLSLLMAAWLGADATAYQSIAANASPAECAELGTKITADPERVGLVVMGDGSACRSEKAPGYVDPRAEPFDAAVADALGRADARALLALDPGLATELLVAGRAPWQVLAGAALATGRPMRGELTYQTAPYGVAYFVAQWHA
jgi:hypothetical protein